MMTRFIDVTRRHLGRFHTGEGGAVALLCLASTLILLMTGLVLYDAGWATREKVEAQVAADTAAYSQAATEARAMNHIAFSNVGKRSVVGVRNMFVAQAIYYVAWVAGRCKKCCCGFWCGCWTACFDCAGNMAGLAPFMAPLRVLEAQLMLGDIGDNVKEIDEYQKSMGDFAPYWSAGEGMLRAMRNGADATASYPPPNNTKYGKLPIRRNTGLFHKTESCLNPVLSFMNRNPVTIGTTAEHLINFEMYKRNSAGRPLIATKGPKQVASRVVAFATCDPLTMAMSPREVAPYHNTTATGTNASSSNSDLMKNSHVVVSYNSEPKLGTTSSDSLRSNYDFMQAKATYGTMKYAPENGGIWSMARSEVFFPKNMKPNTILFRGRHEMWMFHPGYIGKLRPINLPGEVYPSDAKLSKAFTDSGTLTGLITSNVLFGAESGSGTGEIINDWLLMMLSAANGMDGTSKGFGK